MAVVALPKQGSLNFLEEVNEVLNNKKKKKKRERERNDSKIINPHPLLLEVRAFTT